MEASNSSPQQPAPRQPQSGVPPRPMQPMTRRPMVDGFGPPRRPMSPAINQAQPRPVTQSTHVPISDGVQTPRPVLPRHHNPTPTNPAVSNLSQSQQPRPFVTRPTPSATTPTHAAATMPPMPTPAETDDMQTEGKAHIPREHNQTGHAGLAGFIVFIVLGGMLLSPLIPGKVIQNFPLASSTFATGNQLLDCVGTQGTLHNSTVYNTKAGSPLTYTDSTSTTQRATCNGQGQSAVVERTSEFSSLALVVDVLVTVIVAVAVANVWRLIFGNKQHTHSPHS